MLRAFELSYTNMNLIIYLVLIPLVWMFILDRKLRTRLLFVFLYLGAAVMIISLKLIPAGLIFDGLVRFCKRMMEIHHCSYAESCVIWCVIIPTAITIILIAIPQRERKLG